MDKIRSTILICPLNWGLGHATRDIPVIKKCREKGFRVIVAADTSILCLLKSEIPDIETEYFPGAKISYSSGNTQIWKLLKKLPSALYWLIHEKKITAYLVKKHNPVCIISDNRYGVYHRNVKSILITHQLMLKMPKGLSWLEKPFHFLVKALITRFSECWIPDNLISESLAGDLVHKYKKPSNCTLVGPLSRFMDNRDKNIMTKNEGKQSINLLVLLSGPEPQRTILQNILSKKINDEKIQSIIVTGEPENKNETERDDKWIKYYSHLKSEKLKELICTTPYIICRSGYSSIMDLYFLQRSAVIIPTPGQTEQEYLSAYHNKRNHYMITQPELTKENLKSILKRYDSMQTLYSSCFVSSEKLDIAIGSI